MRGSVLLALVLVGATAVAAAEDHPWLVRFQAGSAAIHGKPADRWIEGRVGRSVAADGRVLADLGVAGSPADTGFTAVTAGLEVLPLPRAVLSPFVRGEVGLLVEWDGEYGGYVAGAGGGLALRLGERLGLRAGASWNVHGGQSSPTVYYGGLQYRW
jgi:hypothetical protein